jgi:hypothetical protein
MRFLVAAAVVAAVAVGWAKLAYIDEWQFGDVAVPRVETRQEANELAQLRHALVEADGTKQKLQEAFEASQKEVRELRERTTPPHWHANTMLLNYRSPVPRSSLPGKKAGPQKPPYFVFEGFRGP